MTNKSIWRQKRNIRSVKRIFFLIGFSINTVISAQLYFFDNYGVQEGLAQSTVYTVIQARDHTIWLGTKSGASQFDGFGFINYSIPGVRTIYEDSQGQLWFGHFNGTISRKKNNHFDHYPLTDSLSKVWISSFAEDKFNRLWITTVGNGAYVIKNPAAKIEKMQPEHFIGKNLGDIIFSNYLTLDSTLLFLTSTGIKKLNPDSLSFKPWKLNGLSVFFPNIIMLEDKNHNFWFGTYNGGLGKYDIKMDTLIYYDLKHGLPTNYINYLVEDKNGNIWCSHWDDRKDKCGLSKILPTGEIKVFTSNNGLHDNRTFCLMEDIEGNIIIGTRNNGIDIFKGEAFFSYNSENGLIDNQVNAILEDNEGQFWFGTQGGITVFNEMKKIFIHYNDENNNISSHIVKLKKDIEGNIWIGTDDQGLIVYDNHKNQFTKLPIINNKFPIEAPLVTALEIDKYNNKWVGTLGGGLLQINSQNKYVKTLTNTEDSLLSNSISNIYYSNKGNLLIGCQGRGIVNMDSKKNIIDIIDINQTPTCIVEDLSERIWFGTESKGVFVYKDSIIRVYTTQDGLLANFITLLNVDRNNNVYVGTNKGINIIDPLNQEISTYSKKSGIIGIETKENATYKDSKGRIWFGTVNGVTCFDPFKVQKSEAEPLTKIIKMLVDREEMPMSENLKLKYYQREIAFYYTSICIADPESVRFKIMLAGKEKDWNDKGSDKFHNYGSLAPGKYTFKVIAKNNLGIWNSKPVTFSFRILAPFYQRGFFIVSILLVLTSVILVFIKIRERNLIREKRILEESVQERTQELAEANGELEKKNKDITDSIRYAQRIQFSILPPSIPFKNTFILFKPRDIVSGDFYWMTKHKGIEYIAAVDCTGHGVPGAFMSFIGYTSLNKIVIENGITKPSEILNQLDKEVFNALHQKKEEEGVGDGMDLALIAYDPKNSKLEYSGAYNPLWILKNGEVQEIKANRFAIGRSHVKVKNFTNHEVQISKGDSIYLFSDGYADQFGGDECKKFKVKNLRDLILSIHKEPSEKQKQILDETIEKWRGDFMQIDDILIVGRRF